VKKINLEARDYYTQRNNKIFPNTACMTTARAMFYIGNGIEFLNPSQLQDDDYFTQLMNESAAWKLAARKYPNLITAGYEPREIHGMYHSFLDELVTKERRSDFSTRLTWNDYVERMKAGEVIMTSGSFPDIEGHAFCVIGIDESRLILADPWGDYTTGYKSHRGYGVRMSREDFEKHVKPTGSITKWGHVKI
jgi:hypothetical protein